MGNDVDICHILWDTQRFALDFCEISTETAEEFTSGKWRSGFLWKRRKDGAKRGIYFPARQSFYPYKNVFACANVCLTTNFFRLITTIKLSLGQENIKKRPACRP